MIITEKTISNLIQSQFPYFYQEGGPILVEFVKKYYEWLESSGGAIYHARRIPEYKDVDSTVDQFLVFFKEKYLKNIQFSTAASTKRMVKNSLDLYRSKGTPRAIDLMFKIVFDTPAEVYLPSKDIFKLSSGDFYEQYYLEVTPSPINITFVGKQVQGLQTGATAFVEKLVRKKIKGIYVEVFTISSISPGVRFLTGEILKTANQVSVKRNPKIIGSLSAVKVLTGSEKFSVGDIVDINSELGVGAKGRVTSISDVTGKVDFELIDGGFGYSANARIYISEKVFRLSNVQVNTAISSVNYFQDYDTIVSPQGKVNYITATNTFNVGEQLYTYFSNGDVKGFGIIQTATGNTSSGNISFSVLSGNLIAGGVSSVNAYYTAGNVTSANVGTGGYTDLTQTAVVIGTSSNITINYANSLPFQQFENVFQLSNIGTVSARGRIESINKTNLTGSLFISTTSGLFVQTKNIFGETSGREANVTNLTIDVGLINVNGQFFSNTGNYIYSNNAGNVSYSNATISIISTGSLASFEISNTFANPETVELNTDFVRDYLTVGLDDPDYYFSLTEVVNANSNIGDSLNFDTVTIGTIKFLTAINAGFEYNIDPIVKIDEPLISGYDKKDIIIQTSNASGAFFINEIIRQPNTGARGFIKSINSNSISIRLTNFENSFSNTAANTVIVGTGSSTTANVDYVFIDYNTKAMGLNAIVSANVVSLDGSVTSLEVIDSGVGYVHNELGSFSSLDGERVGTVDLLLGTRTSPEEEQGHEGKSLGRYRTQDGFLSNGKKLQDSFYYQEFSYEIRSAVTLDKYEAMLKQLLHVSGTKYFAAVVRSSILPVQSTITSDFINYVVNVTTDSNVITVDETISVDTNYIP
jgi:hypothetical protein